MNTRKEPATTPESFVDALNSAFGKQATQRAAHAKGVAGGFSTGGVKMRNPQ